MTASIPVRLATGTRPGISSIRGGAVLRRAPRAGPHPSRFHTKDNGNLQPTSVISPRGLVGGSGPDQGMNDPVRRRPRRRSGCVPGLRARSLRRGRVPGPAMPHTPGPREPPGPARPVRRTGRAPGTPTRLPAIRGSPTVPPAATFPPPATYPRTLPGTQRGAAYPPGPDSEADADEDLRRVTATGSPTRLRRRTVPELDTRRGRLLASKPVLSRPVFRLLPASRGCGLSGPGRPGGVRSRLCRRRLRQRRPRGRGVPFRLGSRYPQPGRPLGRSARHRPYARRRPRRHARLRRPATTPPMIAACTAPPAIRATEPRRPRAATRLLPITGPRREARPHRTTGA